VQCDEEGLHVIGIDLSSNNLQGDLPSELGYLSRLESLILSDNRLTSTIPRTLGSIDSLQKLALDHNLLTGSIPAELGNIANLRHLLLDSNMLVGTLPETIGNLKHLTVFSAGHCHLEGALPDALGNLSSLREFYLAGNKLRGSVPQSLLQLETLATIDLRWNALDASDPDLIVFLDSHSPDSDFLSTQTLPPTRITTERIGEKLQGLHIEWEPIRYVANEGGYRIYEAHSETSPTSLLPVILSKGANFLGIIPNSESGDPIADHLIAIESFTLPHAANDNEVVSTRSQWVHAPGPPESPGTISFLPIPIENVDIAEGQSLRIPVFRTGGFRGNISVLARAIGVSAGPEDFISSPQLLVWPDGDSSERYIPISIRADNQVEPAETIRLHLEQPTGGATISYSPMGLRIIDSDISGSGSDPVAARDPDGTILFIWIDREQDGSTAVFGRFGGGAGRPEGNVFQVSEPSAGIDERNPGVVALDRDHFRVTWEDQRGAVRRDATRIRGGVSFSAQRRVASAVDPYTLDVATDEESRHIVFAWSSKDKLIARFSRANGSTIGVVRIDGPAPGKPRQHALAFNPITNRWLIVWEQEQEYDHSAIFGRFFSASGEALSSEIRLHPYGAGRQSQPRVVGTEAGFLVTWLSRPVTSAPDPGRSEIRAVRIRSDGKIIGEFRVNERLIGSQNELTLAIDENGDCTLAWLRDGAEENGLFLKTLEQCRRTETPEEHVSDFERRKVVAPFIVPAVGVVFEIADTLAGDGGISFKVLPRQ
jgi:hypothetical protein